MSAARDEDASGRARESRFASLPIVVVLPVPLTPTTRITAGRACTWRIPGSPRSASISSVSAAPELAEVGACLEPPHELGGRRHADVGGDQRLLEPLPRLVVAGVERRRGELLGERAARLPERVAQPARSRPLRSALGLGRRVLLAEQL